MLTILLMTLLVAAPAFGAFTPLGMAPGKPPSPPIQKETVQLWHEQILDHFKPLDNRKWNQKYFMRNDSYTSGGPIFLFLGGEWDTTGGFIANTGFIGQMVDQLGGMAFELEHRFYGDSLPLPNLETENLAYITIDQTLADAANFAVKMNTDHGLTGPWIVCGTYNSGLLAGFARQKYSHIFHAAYSSSGQMEALVDFFEYHEMTGIGLAKVNPLCPGYLAAAMDEFVAYIEGQQPDDIQYVMESFNICNATDLSKVEDAQYLYDLIANLFASVVQFAIPGTIEAECDLLIDGGGTPMLNLAEVVKRFYPNQPCLYIDYEGTMAYYRNITEPAPGNNYRQYIYQMCTELGWFFTLTGNTPFGNVVPLEYFIKSCSEVFGPQFTAEVLNAGVARTNFEYGGKNPDVTRAIFTHGSFDGWTKVAAEESFGTDAIVLMIEGVGHAADLIFFENDPPQLIEARNTVKEVLQGWIEDFKNKL